MSSSLAIPNYLVNYGQTPHFLFIKTLPNAEQPFKQRQSDVSLELTVVSRVDNRTEDTVGEVNLFDTGISAIIPAGSYLELMASPQLYKAGYMLAHGTHIIQPEDRNNIVVPLYKFRDGPDIDLPFRATQLLPKSAHYVQSSLTARSDERRSIYDAPSAAMTPSYNGGGDTRKTPSNQQNTGRPVKTTSKFF